MHLISFSLLFTLKNKRIWSNPKNNTTWDTEHDIFFVFFACREKLHDPAIESHVRAVVAITTLLKNAPELGSGQIGKDGVLQMMLSMAQSEDKVQQIVAAEALIAASAKKKDTNMIVSQVCCEASID